MSKERLEVLTSGNVTSFLLVHSVTSEKFVTDKTVGGSITINESRKFHPEQWVKLYGVFSNRCDYIITCQVYHLETVIGQHKRNWWDTFLLEPVDEAEQPISIEEAFRRCYCTAS